MVAPVSLVIPPAPAEKIKRDTIRILRDALAEAEAGEIAEIIVIAKRQDGFWFDERSGTMSMSDAVGKIEIIKQSWIATYLLDK
jgi:hypothetical protein